jgi:hypothetical protein
MNNDIVNHFESLHPELSKEFKNIQEQQYILFSSKMLDYGIDNISLGSKLDNIEDTKFSLTGVWLRVNDKINRLKNLLKRNGNSYVKDETMLDNFIDISNYAIIAQLLIKNKWK